MNMKPNGGAAFPKPLTRIGEHEYEEGNEGMSLRDWFAGMALQGMLASPRSIDCEKLDSKNHASYAYAYADAMIAERDKE